MPFLSWGSPCLGERGAGSQAEEGFGGNWKQCSWREVPEVTSWERACSCDVHAGVGWNVSSLFPSQPLLLGIIMLSCCTLKVVIGKGCASPSHHTEK